MAKKLCLMIIDQVNFEGFNKLFKSQFAEVSPVSLDYVPRVTPVGHATISLGSPPSDHGVHGRRWWVSSYGQGGFECDLDKYNRPDFDNNLKNYIIDNSLINKIKGNFKKKENVKVATVIVAAKAFIPFLFGAEKSDIFAFPPFVAPMYDKKNNKFYISVVFCAKSDEGKKVLRDSKLDIFKYWKKLIYHIEPGNGYAAYQSRVNNDLELQWVLDSSCGGKPDISSYFHSLMKKYSPVVDDYYAFVGDLLLSRLEREYLNKYSKCLALLVQSWFSTDTLGHAFGIESDEYKVGLQLAMSTAQDRVEQGYSVAITSDHGGSALRRPLQFRKKSQLVESESQGMYMLKLPSADKVFECGDHLVGFNKKGVVSNVRVLYEDRLSGWLDVGGVTDAIKMRSFSKSYMPLWLVLPKSERFYSHAIAKTPKVNPKGDHGASVEHGVLSKCDNVVPWLVLPSASGFGKSMRIPNRLDEISDIIVSIMNDAN